MLESGACVLRLTCRAELENSEREGKKMGRYKYGFCEWYLPFSGPDTLRFCAELGYEGIQIGDMGGAAQNYPLTNRRLAEAYVEMSQKTGVELQCLNMISVLSDGSLRADPDSELGRRALRTMDKGFEACRLMGISAAFIPSVLGTRIENPCHRENTIENLRRGKERADELGIDFLYESFSPVEETREICRRTGMRLMYDTLNPLKYGFGTDAAAEISAYGTQLIHTVHFKDSTASYTSDVPLGEGVGRVQECARRIREIGYEGWIVSEGTYFRSDLAAAGTDPWKIAEQDLNTLRSLFP